MAKVELSADEKKFKPGDLVWAKMQKFPFWPGKIAMENEIPETLAKPRKKDQLPVFFFGSNNYGHVDEKRLKDYFACRNSMPTPPKNTSNYKAAIEAIEHYISSDCRLMEKLSETKPADPQELQDEIRKLSDATDTDEDKESDSSSKRSLSKMEEGGEAAAAPSEPGPPAKTQKTEKKAAAVAATSTGTKPLLSPSVASLASPTAARKMAAKQPGKTIGFIGLGNIGSKLVKNLLGQQHTVYMLNRNTDKYAQFSSELKAKRANSASSMCRDCDIIFSCLSDASVVDKFLEGSDGILAGIKRGRTCYVEMTSMRMGDSIKNSQKIIAKGGKYLEAAILGDVESAAGGKLVFLCAGDREVFELCESMFSTLTRRSLYLGEVGNGMKAMLIHQQFMGIQTVAVAEALALADRVGLSLQDMYEIFDMSVVSSTLEKKVVKEIMDAVYSPSLKLEQLQAQMQMVTEMGNSADQHLPVTAAANELFKAAKRKGEGEMDFTAVYRALDL